MAIKIKGTGSCLPEKVVTNFDLEKIIETTNEWIVERTGIEQRHVSTGESAADLAFEAAKQALAENNIDGADIDLIIAASCTEEMSFPGIACQVQTSIGAKNAVAFDLNAACSGFIFALNTASAYLENGIYKNALIIGSEVLSKVVDWDDRGTCILFGDGAGAMYIEADSTKPATKFIQRSDGSKGQVLKLTNRENKNAFFEGESETKYLWMDGKEVFRFATRQIPDVINELLDASNMTVEDIDMFVLHQANIRIIENISKRLNADLEKFPSNVSKVGNTSSASIPILFDELRKEGKIVEGMKIILSGFGAGLTYGASLIEF
ncbi:MAG: ketoacyl-ACP synthase III [Lachnospiraceae bacterium]|nr:ketoacyl-ACP synthase III [Lachnospiraceae bacterium]